MKKKSMNDGKQTLLARKKILAAQISAAMMGTSMMAHAAPPEPPPVQTQTELKSGNNSQPPAAAAIIRQPEQLPLPAFPPLQQEFPGIAWESFLAYPELVLAATYDDNIYGQRRSVADDGVITVSPSLALKSNWQQHALNFDVGTDFDRYLNHDQENVNDYWAGFDGRYDLSKTSNLFGGARFSHDHEDRSSPDALSAAQQLEPTLFNHSEAHLGLASGVGKFRIRAGGTFDKYDFEDGVSVSGANVDNDYRNRNMNSLGARLSYVYSPSYEFFAQYATDTRNYDHAITGQTFNRDSDGYRAAAGVKFRRPQQALSGEVFAGHLHQEFDFAGFPDVDKPYFGAQANWRPSPLTGITGFIDRSLEETTVYLAGPPAAYASSSLDTTYGFEVERKLSNKLSINGRAAYTRSEYQNLDRVDEIIDAGAGLRYYVTPVVFVGADLRVIDRDSDDLLAQYSRNQLLVNLGYTPARKRDYSIIPEAEAGAPAAAGASGLYSGLYLGAQIGQGGLTTTTSGPRGGGGLDIGDMGALGESYGLFAGWGQEFGAWYLGAELDASDSSADWYHKKDKPDSRTEHVDKNFSYGLSAKAGRVLDGGLLYGKVGLVRTNFDTYYTENQFAPAGAFAQDQDRDGLRWGVGLEIPASPSLFVRMDYSHTRYDGYDVPYQSSAGGAITTEKFDTEDSLFSLGVGWRFGGERPTAVKRLPTELRGFYAGASVGHGTMATELSGTHMDSGGTLGPFPFYGDFASPGFTGGFFTGYGYTFDRIYVGLDLDAEAANYGWYHTRDTGGGGGRDFAVEKRGSYGAGLRLGYALDNGSLLYGHIGKVQTRFNTIYNKGAGTAHWIDRTDNLNGTRIGLGAEIPATRNTFVRMDYSYTKYDDYGFVTTHDGGTNPDNMNFDNSESLAQLGLGFRF